tara:strand:+ start:305 stop:457 length:153 start_codon:yes stop_codon:yes gene_type:complete
LNLNKKFLVKEDDERPVPPVSLVDGDIIRINKEMQVPARIEEYQKNKEYN